MYNINIFLSILQMNRGSE